MKFRKTTLTVVMVLLISLVLGACGDEGSRQFEEGKR